MRRRVAAARTSCLLFHELVTGCAELQKSPGILVEPLAFGTIESRFSEDTEYGFGTGVVLVVETMHCAEYLVSGQTGVLDMCQLVSAIVNHVVGLRHEAVANRIVVEFGTGIRVSHRHLYGFNVEFLGERNGVING